MTIVSERQHARLYTYTKMGENAKCFNIQKPRQFAKRKTICIAFINTKIQTLYMALWVATTAAWPVPAPVARGPTQTAELPLLALGRYRTRTMRVMEYGGGGEDKDGDRRQKTLGRPGPAGRACPRNYSPVRRVGGGTRTVVQGKEPPIPSDRKSVV